MAPCVSPIVCSNRFDVFPDASNNSLVGQPSTSCDDHALVQASVSAACNNCAPMSVDKDILQIADVVTPQPATTSSLTENLVMAFTDGGFLHVSLRMSGGYWLAGIVGQKISMRGSALNHVIHSNYVRGVSSCHPLFTGSVKPWNNKNPRLY